MFNDSRNDDAIQCDIDNIQIYRNYHNGKTALTSVGLNITLLPVKIPYIEVCIPAMFFFFDRVNN